MAAGAKLLSAASVTTSTTTTTSCPLNGSDQHTLFIKYTPATIGDTLTIDVETSPDDYTLSDATSDWYPDQYWSSTFAHTPVTLSYTSTASTNYVRYDFSTIAQKLRVKLSTSAGVSTVSAAVYSHLLGA